MSSLLVNICWLLSLQKCWASGVTTVCVEKLELNISVDLLSMKLLSFCKGKRPETKTLSRIWGGGGSHPNHRATLHISHSWAIALICIFFLSECSYIYSVLSVAYVNTHHLINRRSIIYCRVELFVVYGSSSVGIKPKTLRLRAQCLRRLRHLDPSIPFLSLKKKKICI